jgi:hypothetical protein
MEGPVAVGRLAPDGAWVGFAADGAGYRLAIGDGDRVRLLGANADLLLALAIAYFEEALDEAPPGLEATHADVSELVRHVAQAEEEPARARLLAEAVDAIDDGLGADAVATRLAAAISRAAAGEANEQADPVDLLVMRVRDALRG